MNARQLAKRLGTTVATIRAWRLSGRIPCLRRNEYDPEQVERVLARNGRPTSMLREESGVSR